MKGRRHGRGFVAESGFRNPISLYNYICAPKPRRRGGVLQVVKGPCGNRLSHRSEGMSRLATRDDDGFRCRQWYHRLRLRDAVLEPVAGHTYRFAGTRNRVPIGSHQGVLAERVELRVELRVVSWRPKSSEFGDERLAQHRHASTMEDGAGFDDRRLRWMVTIHRGRWRRTGLSQRDSRGASALSKRSECGAFRLHDG